MPKQTISEILDSKSENFKEELLKLTIERLEKYAEDSNCEAHRLIHFGFSNHLRKYLIELFTKKYDDKEFYLQNDYVQEFLEITEEELYHFWPKEEDKSNPEDWDLLKVIVIMGCISKDKNYNLDLHISDPKVRKYR